MQSAWFGAVALTMAACAASTDDAHRSSPRAGDEERGVEAATEAMVVPPLLPGVELRLDATLVRAAVSTSLYAVNERQYVGFTVTNVGTTQASPSALVVRCAKDAVTTKSAYPFCYVGDEIVGLPALAPGASFSYGLPQHAIEIGTVTVAQGLSGPFAIDDTFTLQIVSPQYADPAIGTVTLVDHCGSFAECTAAPASTSPGGAGVVSTPFGSGVLHALVAPTRLDLQAWSDAGALGTADPKAFGTIDLQAITLAPAGGDWTGVVETIDVYLDGKLVASGAGTASDPSARLSIALGAADGSLHSLVARTKGDAAHAPSYSRSLSFHIAP